MTRGKKSGNPVDAHVGARIRSARLLVGMSQEKLGGALQLTFQQVQKYEKGRNRVSSSTLQEIANTVGRDVAWFFEGSPGSTIGNGNISGDDPFKLFATTSDGIALARAFNEISDPKLRATLVTLAKALSGRSFDPLPALK